jgi:hypothetical protein
MNKVTLNGALQLGGNGKEFASSLAALVLPGVAVYRRLLWENQLKGNHPICQGADSGGNLHVPRGGDWCIPKLLQNCLRG